MIMADIAKQQKLIDSCRSKNSFWRYIYLHTSTSDKNCLGEALSCKPKVLFFYLIKTIDSVSFADKDWR